MRSYFLVVLVFISSCVMVDRPEFPKSWPDLVKSATTGCAVLTGTYVNTPVERTPRDQYPLLLSELFSDREFDHTNPPPNIVWLNVSSAGLLSAVGDPLTDREVRLTGGPASNAKCLGDGTLKADHAERLWTEHSSGAALGNVKLQRLVDGSLVVEVDASGAQLAVLLVPMIASMRTRLRYKEFE